MRSLPRILACGGFLLLGYVAHAPAIPQADGQVLASHRQVGNDASSPKLARIISLDLRDVLLADALEEVGTQADLALVYSRSMLPSDQRVTLQETRITAGRALVRLLERTGLEVRPLESGHVVIVPVRAADGLPAPEVTTRLAALTSPRTAPLPRRREVTGTISGRVVDGSTQRPLVAAMVVIEGTIEGTIEETQVGVLTREDGDFQMTGLVPGSYQVRASMIGYGAQTQSVVVMSGEVSTVNFQLHTRAVELEGIVAVGYGVQRRQDLTGSVASVDPARLRDLPNTSVVHALQGSAPGVSITHSSAGTEPNFSIRIRGQNSILASNTPLIVIDGIPYNGSLAEINQSDIAAINVLKDASAAAIYGARGANGVILVTTHKGEAGRPRFTYEAYAGTQDMMYKPRVMTGPEFAEFKCERLSEYMSCEDALQGTEWDNLQAGRYTDWIDAVSRRGLQQQHSLSFSGGSDDTRFYISGAALDVDGVALSDTFKRYTARLNLDQRVGPSVEVGLSAQLSQTDRSGLPPSFSTAFGANPLASAFEEDGRTIQVVPWPEDPQRTNPLDNLNVIDDDISRRTVASSYLEAQLPFVRGLTYRINGGLDIQSRDRGRYHGRDTRTGLSTQGRADIESQRVFDWTVENLFRMNGQRDLHSLDVTALFSFHGLDREVNFSRAEGFPNDILAYRQMNVARSVAPTHNVQRSGLVSQMGRINYGYDGRYLVTLTARRDGFSGFGANYKYGVFPSIALAWNLSDESFWNVQTVNVLRLRASYGQNGNQAIQPYQTLARLSERSSVDDGGNTWPGFIPATLANEDLRWESTSSMNAGADFGLFGNRVHGTLDVYSSTTRDLLLERLISPVHGIERMVDNIGSVRNRGVELGLSVTTLDASRFTWTTDFNISANRNKILELYGDGTDDLLNEWFIGQPINTNFGWVFDGVWQVGDDIANSAQPDAQPGDTRVRDVNDDGRIDAADRVFLGTEDPTFIAGLSNTLRYGSVTLNFFIHTVQGVHRYNELLLANVAGGASGVVRENALLFDYWTPDNPINTRWANRESANVFGIAQHDLGVGVFDDASFVRLKDVRLSYDLPPAIVGRLGAESLRVYGAGRNLWTWTKWRGTDPELGGQRNIPLERVYTVGVNVSF